MITTSPLQMEIMGAKKGQSAVVELKRKLSPMEKVVIVTSTFLGGMGFLRLVKLLDSSQLGFLGDFIHFWGVFSLLITLTQEKTCAGLSLKSLQLTALHLAAKASYSFLVESGIPMFDVYSCLATLCVVCMVRFKFKSIHVDNQENFNMLYMVIPCALLSLAIHPVFFCCYLRSVSLLPQLQLMRRRRIIEPFTAEYIFVLGAQRLLHVENWVLEILLTRGQSLTFLGDNMWSAFMAVLSEVVNGFILADFCYYYLTIDFEEQHGMRLPPGVV